MSPTNRIRLTLLSAALATGAVLTLAPTQAQAQHCKWRYAEAFQRLANRSLAGQTPAQATRVIEDLFGPRLEVCGENGYKLFYSQITTYATQSFRKKGAEREAMLTATQEILRRAPQQVRFKAEPDKGTLIKQLRSDLGVIASEVGVTPSIQAVLDAVDKLTPARPSPRPEAKDEDTIKVTVPNAPLPPWAVIYLYEIQDHLARKEIAAAANKNAMVLQWVKLVAAGNDPSTIQVDPSTAPVSSAPIGRPAPAPAPAAPAPAPAR